MLSVLGRITILNTVIAFSLILRFIKNTGQKMRISYHMGQRTKKEEKDFKKWDLMYAGNRSVGFITLNIIEDQIAHRIIHTLTQIGISIMNVKLWTGISL